MPLWHRGLGQLAPPLPEPQFPLRRDATPIPVVVVSRVARHPVPGSVGEQSGAQPWRGVEVPSHFYSVTLGQGVRFGRQLLFCKRKITSSAWTLRHSALSGDKQLAALSLTLKGLWCSWGQTTRWLMHTVTGASFISKSSPWVQQLREWCPNCLTHVTINLDLSTPAHCHLCCSSQGTASVLPGASLIPHIPVHSEHGSSYLCRVLCPDRTFRWWPGHSGSAPPFPAVVYRRVAALFRASPAFPGRGSAAHARGPRARALPAVSQPCTSGTLIHRPPHLSDTRGPGL